MANKRPTQSPHPQSPTLRTPDGAGGKAEVLITRRNLLLGAAAVGGAALLAGGAYVVGNVGKDDSADVLEVPTDAVTYADSFEEINWGDRLSLYAEVELDYGTLVWCNDPDFAVCLLPTEGAKPLASVGVISLASGSCSTVLESALGQDDGFEIYDVRGNGQGLIWTEANILDGVWRVYTAPMSDLTLGEPALAAEGNADWETPSVAVAGSRAFWQVLPTSDGSQSDSESTLMAAAFGSSNAQAVLSSPGRMATPPYALSDSLVLTPRTDASSVHYQLTKIDASTGEVQDTMTLPSSMSPLEAGYGPNGFTFCFDAIYDYGDGISGLGTYTPLEHVEAKAPADAAQEGQAQKDEEAGPTTNSDAYSQAGWLCLNRTPSAAPAWCGNLFMVKSTSAVVGIDLDARAYFSLDVANGAEDYGEYLASTGEAERVVTYTNIDYTPLSGDSEKLCRVRVWQAL